MVSIKNLIKNGERFKNRECHQSIINSRLQEISENQTLNTICFEHIAYSISDLSNIINQLDNKGATLNAVDFIIPREMMKFANDFLKRLIEFQENIKYERLMDGIQKAQEKGIKFGRENKLTETQTKELKARKAKGIYIKNLMEEFKLSKASIYRYLKL